MPAHHSAAARSVISWIMHHHHQKDQKIPIPALNYFKMIEILKVLSVSTSPVTWGGLKKSVCLINSHTALVSYLKLLEDLKLISRIKVRYGGGFAPMKSAISITQTGWILLNTVESTERVKK
jgi:hypothetical protein